MLYPYRSAIREVGSTLQTLIQPMVFTRERPRYVMSAVIMTLLLALMSASLGSLLPFILVIFGQFALFLTLRMSGIYLPALLVSLCGCLIGMMIPWEMLQHFMALNSPPLQIALSMLLSTVSMGPYWLLDIGADITMQLHVLEDRDD